MMLYLDAVTRAGKGGGHVIFVMLSLSNFRSKINFCDASLICNVNKVYNRGFAISSYHRHAQQVSPIP
jgi:hypothetical protein